jgi:hypothetical protein
MVAIPLTADAAGTILATARRLHCAKTRPSAEQQNARLVAQSARGDYSLPSTGSTYPQVAVPTTIAIIISQLPHRQNQDSLAERL